MDTLSCNLVGHIYGHKLYYKDGNYEVGKNFYAYAGYVLQDDGHAYNYAHIVKFTVPEFYGVSESIVYNVYSVDAYGGDNCTLRYAVCKSDSNKDSYLEASGAVSDSNQISTGTVNFPSLSSEPIKCSLTIPVVGLEKMATYYLILWAHNETGVSILNVNNAWGTNSISLNYGQPAFHAHSYTETVVPPTCLSKGYTSNHCSCGYGYADDYVNALGHRWNSGVITVSPTYDSAGVMTYTCSGCGITHESQIAKLGAISNLMPTVSISKSSNEKKYVPYVYDADTGTWKRHIAYTSNNSAFNPRC